MPLERGKVFGRAEAAYAIVSSTAKGTKERGALIRIFVEDGHVKCSKSVLYELIRKYEEGKPFHNGEWRLPGRPRGKYAQDTTTKNKRPCPVPPLLKDIKPINQQCMNGDLVRHSVSERCGWKGRVNLLVTPVRICDEVHSINLNLPLNDGIVRYYNICEYLGQFGEYNVEERKWKDSCLDTRVSKLYFPPKLFPPPKNLDEGGSGCTYLRVKYMIKSDSGNTNKCSNSPVVCNGGSKARRTKVFRCKNSYRTDDNNKGTATCPFSFTLSWDEFGYFIYLRGGKFWSHNVGCSWHCCGRK